MISHPDCGCTSCIKLRGGGSDAPTATPLELVDCEIYHGLDISEIWEMPFKEAKLAFSIIYTRDVLAQHSTLTDAARRMGISLGQVRELRKKVEMHDKLLHARKIERGR